MKILLILNNPPGSNPPNPFQTQLRLAASSNNITDIRLLLRCRHNISLTPTDINIALIDASRAGHERIVRVLLEAGADVNFTFSLSDTGIGGDGDGDKGSALLAASRNGWSEVMRVLLEAGARVREVQTYGVILREILDEFGWDGVKFRRG
ncbi:hypothetical protein VTL71DRAFT_5717 [Oculimacula yallundae]|uniref:Ankyrin n=1 Tax=Oculimacula yallundae TaxID=86028 RepID=A0ABR4BYF0_9HELO